MAKKFTVKDMVLCSLLAAMTGILSQIGIPIGEIPINLALFSVYLAGGLLGSYKGAVSMVVYIMMGAVGLPVFSNFRGGLSVFSGPHGRLHFRISFCSAGRWHGIVLLGRFLLEAGDWDGRRFDFVCPFGTVWFVLLTGNGLAAALSACVLPFCPATR